MRRAILACSVLGSLLLAGCSSTDAPGDVDGPVGTDESAIAYGSPDSAHTAVVALLGNAGSGSFDECSGTIVQVKNGSGYVLTAAHCCDNTVPSIVVMSSDYTVGEQYIFGGTPQPPVYAVTSGSVYWDTKYVPNSNSAYDFCMLKFAAPASAAVIPVAQPGQDGLSLGVDVEHVGFGETDTSSSNSGRRTGTAPVNLQLTSTILQSSQGGSSDTPGVCEGDSGGPALVPAGAAQSQQMVVGTTSTGDASSCATNTENTCMRVTSETGPGGFITNYLNDDTTGGSPGGSGPPASCGLTTMDPTCDDCIDTSCCSQAKACAEDPNCPACASSGCTTDAAASALVQCIEQACASACGAGSSSSSSGGTSCGLMSSIAACNTCLDASCCSQAQACAADSGCTACLTANPAPSCQTESNFVALAECLDQSCASPCGGSSSSSSSVSSSGASASSSASSSSGTTGQGGQGGEGASGSSSGSGGGGIALSKSGCGCVLAGEEDPAHGASLACLLVGAALVSRRRRAVIARGCARTSRATPRTP